VRLLEEPLLERSQQKENHSEHRHDEDELGHGFGIKRHHSTAMEQLPIPEGEDDGHLAIGGFGLTANHFPPKCLCVRSGRTFLSKNLEGQHGIASVTSGTIVHLFDWHSADQASRAQTKKCSTRAAFRL
jgi:hypothetical protein